MENTFGLYFQLGFQHIVDWDALDHILFLLALCAVYTLVQWKQVLWLITAFTVGHCITLIVSGLDVFRLPAHWIETLIPVTIALTAVYNVSTATTQRRAGLLYGAALFFGLVHGMGFSNTFRALLFPGEESQLVTQLLAFNVGIEVGQVLIVGGILLVSSVVVGQLQLPTRYWNWVLSGVAFVVAVSMVVTRVGGWA